MSKLHQGQLAMTLWKLEDKRESPYRTKLHRIYMLEIEETKEWLRKTYPMHNDKKPLPYLYVAWALGLTGEQPELMVRWFITVGQLKNTTIPSVAEFIVKRDIDQLKKEDFTDTLETIETLIDDFCNNRIIKRKEYAKELCVSDRAFDRFIEHLERSHVCEKLTK
ncbi:MAG: hypothetical protein ACWGHH_06510 [Sulfurovaceae bacterium]